MKKHGVKFHEGIPDSEQLPVWFPKGGLLVLDDLMEEGRNDKRVLDLFTKHLHHQNMTVIYLCQDMFPPGKYTKSISQNAHYIFASRIREINWACIIYFYKPFPLNGRTSKTRFDVSLMVLSATCYWIFIPRAPISSHHESATKRRGICALSSVETRCCAVKWIGFQDSSTSVNVI